MLMISLIGLRWLGGPLCERVALGMVETFSGGLAVSWTFQDATQHLFGAAAVLAMAILPVLSLMFIAGIVVNVSQTGLLLTPTAVAPKLSNISPLAGLKRILSVRGLMRLGFGIFKVMIITVVAYVAVRTRAEAIVSMWSETVPVLARALFENIFGICLWIAAALLVLGVIEYAFQRWRYEEDLKMTDQEMREEMKESQGDPQMQARRKQMQRQMAMQRINSDVPSADVVVTNPTELAIAISYKPETMIAPVVIAKGAGAVAQRIRKIALENGVPVVERKPLAQFLFKTVDVGGAVPAEQYQAVAEVLRYVYQLKGKKIPKAG
jgi:flagellar biosynthetic protein FlhB